MPRTCSRNTGHSLHSYFSITCTSANRYQQFPSTCLCILQTDRYIHGFYKSSSWWDSVSQKRTPNIVREKPRQIFNCWTSSELLLCKRRKIILSQEHLSFIQLCREHAHGTRGIQFTVISALRVQVPKDTNNSLQSVCAFFRSTATSTTFTRAHLDKIPCHKKELRT